MVRSSPILAFIAEISCSCWDLRISASVQPENELLAIRVYRHLKWGDAMSESVGGRRDSEAGRGLGRREFLVLSATGILTPWLSRAAAAAAPRLSSSPIVAPPVPMSVGYVEVSDTWKSLRRLPW